MNRERWQAIKVVYSQVRDLPPAGRDALLALQELSDPDVALGVRELLKTSATADGFLDPPQPEELEQPLRKLSFDFTGCMLGEFELVREIGRGASGVVYQGRQRSLGRDVAIKILAPHLTVSESRRTRFEREAFAASKIRHQNVVSVLSCGEQGGVLYLVLEFVQGRSLNAHLENLQRDPRGTSGESVSARLRDPREAARIVEAIARGLEACHAVGVIHRDVKPHNILLDERLEPRLVDFGLAKDAELEGLSDTGSLSGTPNYMSPEQAQGKLVDPRTDIYSLGAVLYELLTLRPPSAANNTQAVLEEIVHAVPPAPHKLDPEIPRPLSRICQKALSKDIESRYATAGALAGDLREFLEGGRVMTNWTWFVGVRARSFLRRHPWVPAVAMVVVAALWIAGAPRARPVKAAPSAATVYDHETGRPPANTPMRHLIRYQESLLPDDPTPVNETSAEGEERPHGQADQDDRHDD